MESKESNRSLVEKLGRGFALGALALLPLYSSGCNTPYEGVGVIGAIEIADRIYGKTSNQKSTLKQQESNGKERNLTSLNNEIGFIEGFNIARDLSKILDCFRSREIDPTWYEAPVPEDF